MREKRKRGRRDRTADFRWIGLFPHYYLAVPYVAGEKGGRAKLEGRHRGKRIMGEKKGGEKKKRLPRNLSIHHILHTAKNKKEKCCSPEIPNVEAGRKKGGVPRNSSLIAWKR